MLGLTLDRRPDLRDPVLIVAFSGWNDAGEAATAAVRWLVRRLPAQRMGGIDPECYHDFTSTRPTVRHAGGERRITWPQHDLYYHTDPESPRDLVMLVAREPELRWRTYSETVLEAARELGAAMLVTLGAFLGDTPHRRPVPVTGFATTDELRAELYSQGLGLSNYEGSTGVVSVLHQFARDAGLPSASLWAAVPQYLPTTANPKAALALLRELRTLLGLGIDLQRLEAAASFFQRQVDEAIGRDRRATGYIRELERQSDDDPDEEPRRGRANLPSADEVIRDLEAFLRTSREEEDDTENGG
jgi:proteasome assembly chaperone (PAC2) family protein